MLQLNTASYFRPFCSNWLGARMLVGLAGFLIGLHWTSLTYTDEWELLPFEFFVITKNWIIFWHKPELGISWYLSRKLTWLIFEVSLSNSLPLFPFLCHTCPKCWWFNIAVGYFKMFCAKSYLKVPNRLSLFYCFAKQMSSVLNFLPHLLTKLFSSIFFLFLFLWRQGCWGGSWTR